MPKVMVSRAAVSSDYSQRLEPNNQVLAADLKYLSRHKLAFCLCVLIISITV